MRILSGIQPTGLIHLGNYFGELKQRINLQKKNDCYFMVVDLHALTIPQNSAQFKQNIESAILDYLAVGLDPKKCTLFVQSQVVGHTELAWILGTLTPLGELERMTQFKEKSSQHKQNINAGLFTYPILQAADILLYKANTVPVGEDQVQHVELTRVIAKKFNNAFGMTFPEPQALLTPTPRVMSLTEPASTMSKSKGEKNYIALSDEPETIRKKIRSAVTDTQ